MKKFADLDQAVNVWIAAAGFPPGNGFSGEVERVGEFLLG